MTLEQKARQLASTLIGEDQNQGPLIEALIEMATWQREQISIHLGLTKNGLNKYI